MRTAAQLDEAWIETGPAPPLRSAPVNWMKAGTPEFTRASWAMFLVGLASFSMIYAVQPLLPKFKAAFGLSPASASLALSLTTSTLSLSILASAILGPFVSRRSTMFLAMTVGGLLNIVVAICSDWTTLLAARALEGVALGAVPAVAMAYLAEEIMPSQLGRAMGLYVAGTAFGGMIGRVGMGVLTEFASWQVAMAALGVLGLASAVGFILLVPPSRNAPTIKSLRLAHHFGTWRSMLSDPRLRRLFILGFLATGVFVTVLNYLTFRLSAAPFGLGQGAISFVFLTYLAGMATSSLSGRLADRMDRRYMIILGFGVAIIGIVMTLSLSLVVMVIGVTVLTGAFFVAHSAASGAVGINAGEAKGHGSSMYLFFYYSGSSLMGSVGGWAFGNFGWSGVVAMTCGCAVLACLIAFGVQAPRSPDAK